MEDETGTDRNALVLEVDTGFLAGVADARDACVLLREAGLEVSNENNQYADHIGIELLFLSVLCGRTADGDDGAAGAARAFCDDRLLVWMGGLCDAANREAPGGYISGLLDLALQLVGALASTC